MVPAQLDRRWRYAIEAWTDPFGVAQGPGRKVEAGQNVDVELEEGALLSRRRQDHAEGGGRSGDEWAAKLRAKTPKKKSAATRASRRRWTTASRPHERAPDRTGSTTSDVLELTVDRERARFGACTSSSLARPDQDQARHVQDRPQDASLRGGHGLRRRLPASDHPSDRVPQGKNNKLKAGPKDVGSPGRSARKQWAQGRHPNSADRGLRSRRRARGWARGLLDSRSNAPRPSVGRGAPGVVQHRPDGTIKYARTRQRSTRTSTRSTSTRRIGSGCGTSSGRSWTSGSVTVSRSSASTTPTRSRSRSGVGHRRHPREHPDVIFRRKPSPGSDADAREARLHPSYSIHVAQLQVGDRGVPPS